MYYLILKCLHIVFAIIAMGTGFDIALFQWSTFCASGLIVFGMGTTRVICAVPSASKVAESVATPFDAHGSWLTSRKHFRR